MEKGTKGIIIGASAGVLAGAIAGILFAPQSGEKTRADIANYVGEMKDKIADELVKAGELTRDVYNDTVEKIVKVYELEKKISSEDAKDIKEKLINNYEEVEKAVKE